MATTVPYFEITDVGLAAASVATPTGPFIDIVGFQIGDGYGYEPTPEDTGIDGNLLYSGTPTSYQLLPNNTLNILCQIPPSAGPFAFGEVALMLPGNVMFAKAVFPTPQQKYSNLNTNVVNTFTLNCLLTLKQSVAVFNITVTEEPGVLNIYQWSDVIPASTASVQSAVPTLLVHELDEFGDSTLLENSTAAWAVGTSYGRYATYAANPSGLYTVAASSTTWVEVAASQLHPADLTTTNRRFVIRTPDGYFRSVNNVVVSGSNYRFNMNCTNDGTYNNSPLPDAPTVGANIVIYRDDQRGGSIYYSQIIDPPSIPLATNGTPGLAYGANGTYMPNPGIIQVHGMLQAPSTNTGRVLTSSDDLNNFGLASGMYVASGSSGNPANMPISLPANVWIHNIGNGSSSANGTDVTQVVFPWNTAGGDSNGVGGLPPYWRQGHNGNAWTTWQPFLVLNKQGASGLWTTSNYQPLTVNGIGYCAFIVKNGDSSQSAPEGTVMALPGRPGSWLSTGSAAAAADYWNVWTRIA
jgi:hypothetical protein